MLFICFITRNDGIFFWLYIETIVNLEQFLKLGKQKISRKKKEKLKIGKERNRRDLKKKRREIRGRKEKLNIGKKRNRRDLKEKTEK